MHTLTATLDEQTYLRVRAIAAVRGLAPEQVVAELLHDALEREPAAQRAERALDELADRPDRPSDEKAMALAVAEQRAMRAERRASGRP